MKKISVIGLSVVLVLSLCACSFSFSTANFQNLAMSSEIDEETFKPVNTATVFSPDTATIYLTGLIKNAPGDTDIKVQWNYIEDEPKVDLGSETYTVKDSDTPFEFHISMKGETFPVGQYEVRLYIDDKIEKSVKFEVSDTGEAATTAKPGETNVKPEATTDAPVVTTGITEPSIAYFQDLETSEGVDEDTYKPLAVTGTFLTTTPKIYLTGSLMNAKPGDEIKGDWQYREGLTPVDIHTSVLAIENVDTIFYFPCVMPEGGWDRGTYEIQLYINGAYDTTASFYVE